MNKVESTVASAAGLSQLERVTGIFIAPSRTFEDIRSGHRSWWLPFLILAIVSYTLFAAVTQRIGIQQTIQNQIRMSPRLQEQMAQANPEQIEKAASLSADLTEGAFIAAPAMGLLYALVIAAVFIGTINFGFGGRARLGDMFAVIYYAWLPGAIQVLMGIAVMWFQPPEVFNVKNFVPTNPAALFLDPASTSQALYSLASQLDIITIWTLVLLSIGLATIAGVKRSAAYFAVFGWWAIVVFFKVATASFFG